MSFSRGLTKVAVIGPMVEAANLGIPSAIGYVHGKQVGEAEGPIEKDPPSKAGKMLRFLMIPGYAGYRFGKTKGHLAAAQKKLKEKEEE